MQHLFKKKTLYYGKLRNIQKKREYYNDSPPDSHHSDSIMINL